MAKTFGNDCDWRGTKLEVGQTVLYGAGVGSHSIALVEGKIDTPPDNGKVRVRIIRRAYLSGSNAVVTVMTDRVTVVDSLPPTTLPSQEEVTQEAELRSFARHAKKATHRLPPVPRMPVRRAKKYQDATPVSTSPNWYGPATTTMGEQLFQADEKAWVAAKYSACLDCGDLSWSQGDRVCPGV